jgi:hypothetical protein
MAGDQSFHKVGAISLDFDGVLSTLVLGRRWVKTHQRRPPVPLLHPAALALGGGVAWMTQRWRKPYPQADDVLRRLRSSGKTLYLLTSRTAERIPPAERWLVQLGWRPLFERLLFNVDGQEADRFKERMLREHPIDVHIDDDPETVAYLAGLFPDKLFVHLDHQHGLSPQGSNIAAVQGWQEMIDLFGVKPIPF